MIYSKAQDVYYLPSGGTLVHLNDILYSLFKSMEYKSVGNNKGVTEQLTTVYMTKTIVVSNNHNRKLTKRNQSKKISTFVLLFAASKATKRFLLWWNVQLRAPDYTKSLSPVWNFSPSCRCLTHVVKVLLKINYDYMEKVSAGIAEDKFQPGPTGPKICHVIVFSLGWNRMSVHCLLDFQPGLQFSM